MIFFTCDCILRALITFKIFMVVYSSYFFYMSVNQ